MLRLRSTTFEGHKCSTGDLQHRQGFPTIFYLSAESAEIQKVQATWLDGMV